jgi:hypothetical protein
MERYVMRKIIVTTTINQPTEAIKLFDSMEDFDLIVIGDKKTPADYTLRRGTYVEPDEQERRYPRLSALLGWNCIQRRNIGFLIALETGADIVVSVDDDNIPKPDWGRDLLVGQSASIRNYGCSAAAFDPIGATNYPYLWHRGFPLQLVNARDYSEHEETTKTVLVQADFWDGDPDVDAVCRMIHHPNCHFDFDGFPFTSRTVAPFNSQNTFLSSSVLPSYFMFPGIGRMDDIWGAYYLQAATGVRPVFNRASVRQDRNEHDLIRDFSLEVRGYEQTLSLLHAIKGDARDFFTFLPGAAVAAFLEYHETACGILASRPTV